MTAGQSKDGIPQNPAPDSRRQTDHDQTMSGSADSTPQPDTGRPDTERPDTGKPGSDQPDGSAPDRLAELRAQIDAADAEMHRQLIHRGRIIAELIEAKKLNAAPSRQSAGQSGAAFRPDREASMMRRIAGRHEGELPLTTVEHIWREIIATFTQLQAPFTVHAAGAGWPRMRDLLRYMFGFSTPLADAPDNRSAVRVVAGGGTDLAVVALASADEERWWDSDAQSDSGQAEAGQVCPGARVIALLPFLPIDDTLDLPPALVIGPSSVESPADLFIYACASAAMTAADPAIRVLRGGPDWTLFASADAPAAVLPRITGCVCLGSIAEPLAWPAGLASKT